LTKTSEPRSTLIEADITDSEEPSWALKAPPSRSEAGRLNSNRDGHPGCVPELDLGESAYGCDRLDAELKAYGIEAIAHHKMENACCDIANAGRSRGYLPGFRISRVLSSVTGGMPRMSWECYPSIVA